MSQSADKVIDHEMLFREPEYQKMLANKKEFDELPEVSKAGLTVHFVEWYYSVIFLTG